ncbi:MAG TPA: VOC family protein [Thermodesulfobacteriota bacterium]|nr:VOC family protein [Thermodesulfobacteriota bacterium]
MEWLRSIFRGEDNISGIDHAAIVVTDMDRAVGFYSGILGLEIIRDGRPEGGDKKTFLGNKNGVFLALTEDKNRIPGGPVNHIAFKVNDIEAAARRLKDAGILFIEEKTGPGGEAIAYHFLDPDGLELEICAPAHNQVPQY